MDIVELIEHPERMDRDTLYELRSLLALYPYFQTARLLMLQNLYLLHDPSFDQELRQAAIYITDRKVLFQMIEAAHYQLKVQNTQPELVDRLDADDRDSRTLSLIDDFLDSLPKDESQQEKKGKRKPTPADAAVDYVAYLLESESDEDREQAAEVPQLIGQSLIDSFINNDKGKIILNENPTLKPDLDADTVDRQKEGEEGYFTETLARIYIKQGNYSKALEIIQQLSLDNPKKNAYFADQMRFLEKLIINSNKK
ncbi:tetratricopeptide repeat protein [uncultured Prevotella sp.]|uniref:tetratricopeptide repeat protein n=1 Tax=uncultured Prevotella sp. TaxID=159272 RepID=UPI0025DB2701|nr:tetratricopeptide repeat protein [uncultured Prevotella sp.]